MQKVKLKTINFLIIALLVACDSNSALKENYPIENVSIPSTEINVEQNDVEQKQQIEINHWEYLEKDRGLYSYHFPNLWTRIEKDKIEVYPFDWFSDFAHADDGSLWMVGGFGVIHRKENGEQNWYSLQNELTRQNYTRVAISPEGEVWVGGTDNALYRFDGIHWTNEGEKLPQSQYKLDWLCYSNNISGIDFGPDGETWIMNNGVEIYAQAYGLWVNIPFPKHLLPWAGGGGCPIGIQVNSYKDITIKRSGCCMSDPVGYHYDGNSWSTDANYDSVDDLIANRHIVEDEVLYDILGEVSSSSFSNWPFDKNKLIPSDFLSRVSDPLITIDENGVVWLNTSVDLFNNSSGTFIDVREENDGWSTDDPDLALSTIINFGKKVMYYQEGKRPYALYWVVGDSIDYYFHDQLFAIDDEDRIWFYIPDRGLAVVDKGSVQIIDKIPDEISKVGGIHITNKNEVLISTRGQIWKYDSGIWSIFFEAKDSDLLFIYFAESDDGVVYAATNTGVFQFNDGLYGSQAFVIQNNKPHVVPEGGVMGGCEDYNYYYTIIGGCPGIWGETGKEYNYEALYLDVLNNNSVIFVNNHVVAKYEDGDWKSFFFDDFSIDSAVVNDLGYIYVFSKSEGLIKFSPDIFVSYEELIEP